jgi:lipopolysaccharide transport system ATP-binding protein
MKPIIRVENLSKQYRIGARQEPYGSLRESLVRTVKTPFERLRRNGFSTDDTIWALKDVSFDVEPGEVVGIIGRNGAGKSTLLKILSRIIGPTTGQVDLYGRVASLLEVGTGFHPELTGRENIYLNGAILGMRRSEIDRKFDAIVAFAEVERFLDTTVKHYSSGMQMRLAFAVAAYLEQEVMVIDEVLAVGDAQFQKKCLGKMEEVADSGRTVLFVSHNLPTVQRLCRMGIYLKDGRIEKIGDINAVIESYQREVANVGRADSNSDAALEVKEGEVRYISWELLESSTRAPHSCMSREECTFSFTLVLRREITKARFGLDIRDLSDQKLITSHNLDNDGEELYMRPGIYRINWRVRVPLRAGAYQLVTGFGCGALNKTLDLYFAQPTLTVLPNVHAHLPEHMHGLINESAEYKLVRQC